MYHRKRWLTCAHVRDFVPNQTEKHLTEQKLAIALYLSYSEKRILIPILIQIYKNSQEK